MGKFRDLLEEKGLFESMQKIYFQQQELTWNKNKTDIEWKNRIKDRTGLKEKDFFALVQRGINLKDKDFCKTGQTCLMFQRSSFIVIIDIPNLKMVTIRDSKWDKIINNEKPCKRVMIFESEEHIIDIIENVNFNLVDFDGYSYHMTGEPLILEVQHNCDCCVSVDL